MGRTHTPVLVCAVGLESVAPLFYSILIVRIDAIDSFMMAGAGRGW